MRQPYVRNSFVGRDRERKLFRDLFNRACEGEGSLVLVGGEAGIGKTTLVRDFIAFAQERGALVLSGGCYDLTTTPPYSPWSEAIRDYKPTGAQPAPPGWFSNPMEMGEIGSQTVLLEEARDFFAAVAEVQPLVIFLEDMHWADPASTETLRFISRYAIGMPVMIIATFRNDELATGPFLQMMPTLVREAATGRIELRRWRKIDTGKLVADWYGLDNNDQQRLTGYVHHLTGGNPFYTMELLRTLEGDGTLRSDLNGWSLAELPGPQVPPLVRQVIERRLDRLTATTRTLLEFASAIDYTVPFKLWQEVSGADAGRLSDAVDEAAGAHLIDLLPGQSRVQFHHALVRETLHEGMNPFQARELHGQCAEVLMKQQNPDPDAVAYHLGQAGDSRQVEWLVRAGERAEHSYALFTAAERYRQAADLIADDPDRLQERGWLLFRVSSVLRWTGLPDGLEAIREAVRISRQVNDPWLAAVTLVDSGFHAGIQGSSYVEALDAMVSGSKELDRLYYSNHDFEDDSGWRQLAIVRPYVTRTRALARMSDPAEFPYIADTWGAAASPICEVGQLKEAREICERMQPVAEQLIEDWPISSHSTGYGDTINVLGRTYAYLGMSEESAAKFRQAGHYYMQRRHFVMVVNNNDHWLGLCSLRFDTENRQLHHELAAEIEEYTEKGGSGVLPGRHISAAVLWLRIIEGKWKEAREVAMAGGHTLHFSQRRLALLSLLDHYQGYDDRVRNRIKMEMPWGPETPPGNYHFLSGLTLQWLAVEHALDEGDCDLAKAWLEANDRWLETTGSGAGHGENRQLWAGYYLLNGDVDMARKHAKQAVQEASNPRQPLVLIAAYRFLGQMETRERYDDLAASYLAEAAELADRCQAPFELALTWLTQAELARSTRDIPRATELLSRATAIFDELEAAPARKRANDLAMDLANLNRDYPDGLTPREAEVLGYVAIGCSNREIADHLYLSVRTIERHLTNIYRKIDAANRSEAREFAQRHSIIHCEDIAAG